MVLQQIIRCCRVLGIAVFVWSVGFSGRLLGQAPSKHNCHCQSDICCCYQVHRSSNAQVFESQNFRIHPTVGFSSVKELVTQCEQHRHRIRERWLGVTQAENWPVKCNVYCYASGAHYQQLTGFPAEMLGHADLEVGEGRVWVRNLHLRVDQPERVTGIVAHELTHIVLADRFCDRQIPRWADEGIAILSEPENRRKQLRSRLAAAVERGTVAPWSELVTTRAYPADRDRAEVFYATSSAWIEFLSVEKRVDGPRLLQFVADVDQIGAEPALAKCVPAVNVATLEQEWRDWLTRRILLASSAK